MGMGERCRSLCGRSVKAEGSIRRCAGPSNGILALRASKRLRAFVEQGSNPEIVIPRDGFVAALLTLRAHFVRLPSPPAKKNGPFWGPFFFGWGRGIRTPVGGVRVRSPTTRRSPNKGSQEARLAFRELRCATCFSEADFLALNFTCVTRNKSGFTQRSTK